MANAMLQHLITLITSGPNPVARVTLSNLILFYLHGNCFSLAHNKNNEMCLNLEQVAILCRN